MGKKEIIERVEEFIKKGKTFIWWMEKLSTRLENSDSKNDFNELGFGRTFLENLVEVENGARGFDELFESIMEFIENWD